mmetsp:Transcript_53788/g.62873  ORF Transcript_53788/g.62873 Transcript_53788/m.62873 type:complete len:125 (-) Transcript_53788:49-423(-)
MFFMMLYDEGAPVCIQDHGSWGDTMNVADAFNDAVEHRTENDYLNETIVSNINLFLAPSRAGPDTSVTSLAINAVICACTCHKKPNDKRIRKKIDDERIQKSIGASKYYFCMKALKGDRANAHI